jgi:hypothetical protein
MTIAMLMRNTITAARLQSAPVGRGFGTTDEHG